MRRTSLVLGALLATTVMSQAFGAKPPGAGEKFKTWCYEATVTSPGPGMNSGDLIYGGFRFSTSAVDVYGEPTNESIGAYTLDRTYIWVPVIDTLWIFEGSAVGKQMTVISAVGTPTPYDFFEIYQRDTPLDSPVDPTKLSFFNGRATALSLFTSDDLPLVPPPVSSFEFLNLQYTDFAGGGYSTTAAVTKLYAARRSTTSVRSDCAASKKQPRRN